MMGVRLVSLSVLLSVTLLVALSVALLADWLGVWSVFLTVVSVVGFVELQRNHTSQARNNCTLY